MARKSKLRTRRNKSKQGKYKRGRKTKRRTRRNRQRGGKSFKEYISSARDKIRGSFQKLKERFRGNGNQPISSQDEINRLRGNRSLIKNMRRDANEITKKLGKVNEGSQVMRGQASDFLASAKKLGQGMS